MWHCEVRDGLLVMKMSSMVLSGWSCDYLFRVGCDKDKIRIDFICNLTVGFNIQ